MTLIVALHKSGEPSFLLPDVALSFGGPPLDSTAFPLQQKMESGYFELPEINNEIVSGNCQKMIFWGNHAIQWAGKNIIAISILKFIKKNLTSLTHKNFLALLKEEYGADLEQVSLIYHFADGVSTHMVHYNCNLCPVGDTLVVCAVSGAYLFIE